MIDGYARGAGEVRRYYLRSWSVRRERGNAAFALYVLDLGDAKALRFARALHLMHPAGPDPAKLAA